MKRSQAKEQIRMDEYEEAMKGIYTTSVSRGTLDESPMAYKPMEMILPYLGETADVEDLLKPVYNFKAGR